MLFRGAGLDVVWGELVWMIELGAIYLSICARSFQDDVVQGQSLSGGIIETRQQRQKEAFAMGNLVQHGNAGDQQAVIEFLACTIKKAVRFSYMDFSTLDLRRRACEREIELNQAHASEPLRLGARHQLSWEI